MALWMLDSGQTSTKRPAWLCRPRLGPTDNVLWASGRRGVSVFDEASGHTGVGVGGRTHNFSIHGGDSCDDFANMV